jgi:predicted RNase H-like HicB family nuclease
MNQYSMILQWSNEDELFLVTIPEFSDTIKDGCQGHRVVMPCTHGKTREEAICNGEEVIEMYLEAWQAENEPIPEPYTLQIA